jgi:hypothetical protein
VIPATAGVGCHTRKTPDGRISHKPGPCDARCVNHSEGVSTAMSPLKRSNKAVAEQLVVTERAVEKHVTSIFGKLRLPATAEDHRRVLAVLTYLGS